MAVAGRTHLTRERHPQVFVEQTQSIRKVVQSNKVLDFGLVLGYTGRGKAQPGQPLAFDRKTKIKTFFGKPQKPAKMRTRVMTANSLNLNDSTFEIPGIVETEETHVQPHTLMFLSNIENLHLNREALDKIVEFDTLNLAGDITNEELYEKILSVVSTYSPLAFDEEVIVTEIENTDPDHDENSSMENVETAPLPEPVPETAPVATEKKKTPPKKITKNTPAIKVVEKKTEKPVEPKAPVVTDAISFIQDISTNVKQLENWFKKNATTEHGIDVTIVRKDIFAQRMRQYLELNMAVSGLLNAALIKVGDQEIDTQHLVSGQILIQGLAILTSEVKQLREKETQSTTLQKQLADAQDQIRNLQTNIIHLERASENLKLREADDAKYRVLERIFVLSRTSAETGKLWFVGQVENAEGDLTAPKNLDIRNCRSVDSLDKAIKFNSLDSAREYLNRIIAFKLAKGKAFKLKSTSLLSVNEITRRQLKTL